MAYEIEGRLLEVCTCNVLCPCWVGEDPDYKTCDTTIAWGIEKGSIEGVSVDGLTMAVSAHIPKNILIPKSWKAVVFVDERATAEQEGVLLQAVHRAARRRDRGPGRPHRRGRRRRAGTDQVHRRRRQGQALDRDAGRGRDGAVRRRDGQPDDAGRDRLQHDPGLARVREQGQPVHARRRAATASRAWISRVTTPSRATSASPPDGRGLEIGRDRCSLPRTSASRSRDRAILAGSLVAIAVIAWLALWLWEGSPYGHYLHHDGLGRRRPDRLGRPRRGGVHGRLDPDDRRDDAAEQRAARRDVRGARRSARRPGAPGRPAARRLSPGLGGVRPGRLGRRPGRPCRRRGPPLARRASRSSSSAATLLVAGLWQFSPLRDRCLDECRSPLGFVLNRWRGTSERREALLMGIAHGAFCVGCCWSLMLVMFGVGHRQPHRDARPRRPDRRSRRTCPRGRRLTRPLGVALVLAAVYAVAA